MASVQEAVRRIRIESTSVGVRESAADLQGLARAEDAVAVASERAGSAADRRRSQQERYAEVINRAAAEHAKYESMLRRVSAANDNFAKSWRGALGALGETTSRGGVLLGALRGLDEWQDKLFGTGGTLSGRLRQLGLEGAVVTGMLKQTRDGFVQLQNPASGASEAIGNVNVAVRTFAADAEPAAKAAAGLSTGLLLIGGGAVVAGAIAAFEGFKSLTRQLAELGDQAKVAVIEVERFQALRFATGSRGLAADTFATGAENIAKKLNEARSEENDLTKLLVANNIKYKDREGIVISTNEALLKGAELIKRAATEHDKIKIAEMLGLTKEWIPALEGGAAELERSAKAATDAGLIISRDIVEKAQEFDRRWKESSQFVSTYIRAWIAESITLIDRLIDKAKELRDSFTQLPQGRTVEDMGFDAAKGQSFIETMRLLGSALFGTKEEWDRFLQAMGQGFPPVPPEIAERAAAVRELAAALRAASESAADYDAFERRRNKAFSDLGPRTIIPTDTKSANEAKNAFDRAIDSAERHIATMEADAKAVGLAAGAHAQLRTEAQLMTAAQRAGIEVTEKQAEKIKELAKRAGEAAQALAQARVRGEIAFQQATLGLSDEDVAIARTLRDIYGNDIPTALNSWEAAALRVINVTKALNDAVKDAAKSFVTDIIKAKDPLEALATALTKLRDKLAEIGFDLLWRQLTGGGGGLANFFSTGTTSMSGGGVAGGLWQTQAQFEHSVAKGMSTAFQSVFKPSVSGSGVGMSGAGLGGGIQIPGLGGLSGQQLGAGIMAIGALGGAFFGGMQSQSPMMGALSGVLSGALGGLVLGGPIGALLGAAAGGGLGYFGGLFGQSESERKKEEARQAHWESMLPDVRVVRRDIRMASRGMEEGQLLSRLNEAQDAIKKIAAESKGKGQAEIAEMRAEYQELKKRLKSEFKETFDIVVEGLQSGFGLNSPAAEAANQVRELGKSLAGFIRDTKEFNNPAMTREARRAAQEAALSLLDAPQELTYVQQRMMELEGASVALQQVLQDLGMTAEQAAKEIEERLNKAIAALRKEFNEELTAKINDASGRGYLNQINALFKEFEKLKTDAELLGLSDGRITKYFNAQAQAILEGSNLSAAALERLAKRFPELASIIDDVLEDMAKSIKRNLVQSIREAEGRGYINQIIGLFTEIRKLEQEGLIDQGLIGEYFNAQAKAILEGANLSIEALRNLAKAFPELSAIVEEVANDIWRTVELTREAFIQNLQTQMNETAGKGYLNQFKTIFDALQQSAEVTLGGMGPNGFQYDSRVLEYVRVQSEAIIRGGTLSAEALKELAQVFPQFSDAVAAALNELRSAFSSDLAAKINDASGKGYLNQFTDLFKEREDLLKRASVLGLGAGDVETYFKLQAQAIVDQAGLVGDAFGELLRMFPNLSQVVRESTAVLEQQAEAQRQLQRNIREYLDSLRIGPQSTLSPVDRLAEAQRIYNEQLGLARGGNQEALGGITQYATSLLESARGVWASSAVYQRIFEQVQEQLRGLIPGMADGGWITGGMPGRDSVLRMLAPGEFVMPSAPAAAHAPMLEAMASGRGANDNGAELAELRVIVAELRNLARVQAAGADATVSALRERLTAVERRLAHLDDTQRIEGNKRPRGKTAAHG